MVARPIAVIVLAAAAGAACTQTARLQAAPAATQTVRPCLPPDSSSASLQRSALSMVSDTSAGARRFRLRFGILTATNQDIVLVQDDATCEAVTAAVERGAARHAEALVVVRIGRSLPHYVAMKRLEIGGGDVALLDAQLTLLTILTGQ